MLLAFGTKIVSKSVPIVEAHIEKNAVQMPHLRTVYMNEVRITLLSEQFLRFSLFKFEPAWEEKEEIILATQQFLDIN